MLFMSINRKTIKPDVRKSENRLIAYIIADAAHDCLNHIDGCGCTDVWLQQPAVYAGCHFHEASQCKSLTPFFRLGVDCRADFRTCEEVPAEIRSLKGKGKPESRNRWIWNFKPC